MAAKTKVELKPQWEGLDPNRMPQHVAVIMDGNRRWAVKRLLPTKQGHRAGVEPLRTLVKACRDLGIRHLTVYAFSTENWSRSAEEVGFLWNLLQESIMREVDGLDAHGVRMRFIGEIDELGQKIRSAIAQAESRTAANDKLTLNIALNYGGRREILEVVKAIAHAAKASEIDIESLDERKLSSFFYTAGQPDPDLLIRTSGEQRISNYLLWQLAYTELYVTPTLWPDFGEEDFRQALLDYQSRQRRYGGRP